MQTLTGIELVQSLEERIERLENRQSYEIIEEGCSGRHKTDYYFELQSQIDELNVELEAAINLAAKTEKKFIVQPYFSSFLFHEVVCFTGHEDGDYVECLTKEWKTWAKKSDIILESEVDSYRIKHAS